MNKTFFGGKDFKGSKFKALIPIYYPLKYTIYIKEETKLLKINEKRMTKIRNELCIMKRDKKLKGKEKGV